MSVYLEREQTFGPRPIGLDELFAFWKKAVLYGFVDRRAHLVCPQRRGFDHAFCYTGARNLEYREEFAGALRWSGDELIVHDLDRPMWRLSLHGAFEPWLFVDEPLALSCGFGDSAVDTSSVRLQAAQKLREAISFARRSVAEEFLPRGPLVYRMDDLWVYRCAWEGSFEEFQGEERLSHNGTRVLTARFHGGLIL